MFCPQCGAKNKDGARYCYRCGGSLPPSELVDGTGDAASETPADGRSDGLGARDDDAPAAGGETGPAQAARDDAAGQASESEGADPASPVPPAGSGDAEPDAAGTERTRLMARDGSSAAGDGAGAPGADTVTSADLNQQVKQARGRSRRRVPMVLFIILVVLALAASAFAATMLYRYVFAHEAGSERTEQAQPAGSADEPDQGDDADKQNGDDAAQADDARTTADAAKQAEPQTQTYTTQVLTGRPSGSAEDADLDVPTVTSPALTFDVPDGWTVQDAGYRQIGYGEYLQQTAAWQATIVNNSTGVTLSLSLKLGSSGGAFGSDTTFQKLADSQLGAEYAVMSVSTPMPSLGKTFTDIELREIGAMGESTIYADNLAIGFSVSSPEDPQPTDPGMQEAIQIIGSLRVAQ